MNKIRTDLAKLASEIEKIKAIGIAGSHARGTADQLSDIDLCIYVSGELPGVKERTRAYSELGFTEVIYIDVDFENSFGDGFRYKGVRYDFNWMSIDSVRVFLKKLETDFGTTEYIPGGLRIVKALHDPNDMILELQALIPEYSDERAKFRIKKNFDEVHFSLNELGWLEKAAYRRDIFLFLKYKNNILEALFRILYALNKKWLSDEKGLVGRISSFQYCPDQIEKRMNSIIMHQDEDTDLGRCLLSIKKIIADTVQISHQKYPELELPNDWE